MRETPGREDRAPAEEGGRRGLVPRPARRRVRRHALVDLAPEDYDCVTIVTAHTSVDYGELVRRAQIVVDFRNATKGHEVEGKVWKL
jgi:UDP-N-acetyl-D-mannosaminuronate dehydrogenase